MCEPEQKAYGQAQPLDHRCGWHSNCRANVDSIRPTGTLGSRLGHPATIEMEKRPWTRNDIAEAQYG